MLSNKMLVVIYVVFLVFSFSFTPALAQFEEGEGVSLAKILGYEDVEETGEIPEDKPKSRTDREFLEEIYRETFAFILNHVNHKTGLPYDSNKKKGPTSITNIGFYLASVAVGAKTGMLSDVDAKNLIAEALDSLEKIPKWHGFPVTWVDVNTLEQAYGPEFSYADHLGNLIAGLLVVEGIYPEFTGRIKTYMSRFNFKPLYDEQTGWLKGGYNTQTDDFAIKQDWGEWYYNLVGSDTRFFSFYGIARGEFPEEHWDNLDWTTEEMYGYEYLTPGWQGGGLFMQYISGIFLDERNTILGDSARFFAEAQMEHARRLGYPVWGWSACITPWGEYRGWGKIMDKVVTPHASALAINDFPEEVITNLRELEKMGAKLPLSGNYFGFRDSIDVESGKIAPTYLMLDQTMIFLSLANYFYDGIVWKACMSDPVVREGFNRIYKTVGTQT